MTANLEGGGAKALEVRPLKNTFFAASLRKTVLRGFVETVLGGFEKMVIGGFVK